MHDFVIVGIPLLVILAGILLNRADAKELRAEILRLDANIDKPGSDLRAEVAKQGSDLRMEIARQHAGTLQQP